MPWIHGMNVRLFVSKQDKLMIARWLTPSGQVCSYTVVWCWSCYSVKPRLGIRFSVRTRTIRRLFWSTMASLSSVMLKLFNKGRPVLPPLVTTGLPGPVSNDWYHINVIFFPHWVRLKNLYIAGIIEFVQRLRLVFDQREPGDRLGLLFTSRAQTAMQKYLSCQMFTTARNSWDLERKKKKIQVWCPNAVVNEMQDSQSAGADIKVMSTCYKRTLCHILSHTHDQIKLLRKHRA